MTTIREEAEAIAAEVGIEPLVVLAILEALIRLWALCRAIDPVAALREQVRNHTGRTRRRVMREGKKRGLILIKRQQLATATICRCQLLADERLAMCYREVAV